MQDRVPLYPGRVTLTPVSGQDNTYDMTRADQPTQEGTPLNKATLLADETANLYGGVDTPDDAFNALLTERLTWQVGDILATVRTDLGDKWLLCNGEFIDQEQYPELSGILPYDMETATWTGRQISTTDTAYIYDLACYNGTWVAVGYDSTYPYIYYTTDPTGTWTRKQISTTGIYLRGVTCYNGTWVAVGSGSGTRGYPYVCTATDPSGTWTVHQLSTSMEVTLWGVCCYNGTWVAVGAYGTSSLPYIYTTTDLSGTWTGQQLTSSTEMSGVLRSVACYNGTWVAVGTGGYAFVSTNPTGTWTSKLIGSGYVLYDVACYDGRWVAVGRTNTGSGGDPVVCTTTSPTGTWTIQELDATQTPYLYSVACDNGTWVAVGSGYNSSYRYPYAFATTDPTGTWTGQQLSSELIYLYGVAYYNGMWVAAGYTSSDGYPYIYTAGLRLPAVTSDNSYVYIKAKGDADE